MISSTALDLPDHRKEIHEGCERAGFEPHMMEMLPALDADALAQHDATLILTDHDAFDYDQIVQASKLVIDTRNATAKVANAREKIVFA